MVMIEDRLRKGSEEPMSEEENRPRGRSAPISPFPDVNAIGPGKVAAASLVVLFGPAAWSGTVQVIDTASAAGAVVIDTVGAEASRTVQETASILRACLRLGVIGGSSVAALACASRVWTCRRPCPRRSTDLVAAVRRQGPTDGKAEVTDGAGMLEGVPPLSGNGFRTPGLRELEYGTRSWRQSWDVAKTYEFQKYEAAENRIKALVGKYFVVASSEAPLAPTCTCPDFAKRGPLCKHATGLYLRVLAGLVEKSAPTERLVPKLVREIESYPLRREARSLRAAGARLAATERGDPFNQAARDLRGALAEAVAEDSCAPRPRSSPPRNGIASLGSLEESVGSPCLWSVREFYDAKSGMDCWLQQIASAGPGDRVQCLFYTFDHPDLVGALRDASGRGAAVQVVVDREYLRSEKCKGVRGAVKALMVSGALVREATDSMRPHGGFRGVQHCKAVYS